MFLVKRTLTGLLVLLLFGSCSFPDTKLYDGIAHERSLDDMEIIVNRMGFFEGNWECARRQGVPVILVPWLFSYNGCATVPMDWYLEEHKQTKWCNVVLTIDSDIVLQHELQHCKGYEY